MLETRVLLLHPAAGAVRKLADAADGTAVGFARWDRDAAAGWWGRWLGPVLHVYEQEDAPLVFTVRRCWFWWPRYEVRDAEGEPVGSVSRKTIRDRNLYLYARARWEDEELVIKSVNFEVLASMRLTPKGVELAFAKAVEPDPFAKMLLLAAALLQDEVR